jgi:hypothetical protein
MLPSTRRAYPPNSWPFFNYADNAELKNENGRFLNVLRDRPMNSALPTATENNPYAELGIRGISIRDVAWLSG